MKRLIYSLFALFISSHQIASAAVSPVIVTSEIINDSWFPLPLEQMKDAAVDTALTRISETGNFAFLFKSNITKDKSAGILNLRVTLVEPAESAKITIKLSLPNQAGTYVSSSSISLKGKDHKGIFNSLEILGKEGAEQIFLATEELTIKTTISNEEKKLREHIIDLNKTIIQLNYSVKNLDLSSHNEKVEKRLASLDTIINKLDEHHEYTKNSDVKKNEKLDAIYSEIKKLNIGSHTDNKLPGSNELTDYDITQLAQIKKANKLKYKKKFITARKILKKVFTDKKISPMLRSVIKEEMDINLPIYAAGIASNNLPKFFSTKTQQNNADVGKKIKYINRLYDYVLSQPDLSITKRKEISDKKSQINLTGESIGTVVAMLSIASKNNLSVALRHLMNKHMMHLAMGIQDTGNGQCPNEDSVKKEMKIAGVSADIISYDNLKEYRCKLALKLRDSSKQKLTYTFDERVAEYN